MENILKNVKNWVEKFPVSFSIVLVCALTWIAELVLGNKFIISGVFAPFVAFEQPWRWITSIFMHDASSPLHIFFNMFAFVSCAPIFERILGWKKFIILFLGSGLAGNVFMWLYFLVTNSSSVSLGASGAVFGLFGGLIVLHKYLGQNAKGILMTVGLNLLLCVFLSGIAWQAHIGGLLAGIAITYAFLKKSRMRVF